MRRKSQLGEHARGTRRAKSDKPIIIQDIRCNIRTIPAVWLMIHTLKGYPTKRPTKGIRMLIRHALFAGILLAFLLSTTVRAEDAAANWPRWRGPQDTGASQTAKPPIEWSETKNIKWKVEIPGSSHATPIVWGDRVFVQTAIKMVPKKKDDKPASAMHGDAFPTDVTFATMQPDEPRRRGRRGGRGGRGRGRRQREKPTDTFNFNLLAIDRATGKVLWQTTCVEEVPHESLHQDSTQASNSPVTDGKHVYAYFGTRGLHCIDWNGKLVWSKRFGTMSTRNEFGEGSSPTIHGDTIVITWDHEGDSFIVALDKKTGEEKWKVSRDEPTAWATPIVVEDSGKAVVVSSAANYVRGYDLATGELVWKCGGLTNNIISSPVAQDGVVYCMSSRRGEMAMAIRYAGAKGDITDSERVLWTDDKNTPYVPSPLLYDGSLYFTKARPFVVSALNARDGKPRFEPQRLSDLAGMYASPVAADGKIYFVGREGTTVVLKHGDAFKVLATNKLDDGFDASPALAGDEIFLRGRKHLYCIAQ